MAIDEAACLGIPVLTTQTTSADEMVTESQRGWVCENHQHALNRALTELLREPELLRNKKMQLAGVRVDNRLAVEQFRLLIEG